MQTKMPQNKLIEYEANVENDSSFNFVGYTLSAGSVCFLHELQSIVIIQVCWSLIVEK